MSELNEERWSVMSERGRERAGLSYADAAALVRALTEEKVHGLCVVTDDAAARLAALSASASANGGARKPPRKGGRTRRAPKSA